MIEKKKRGAKKGSVRPVGAGRPEIPVNYGKVFLLLGKGYSKGQIGKLFNFKYPGTFNNKICRFKEVDDIKHINFMIKCLKEYKEELKK